MNSAVVVGSGPNGLAAAVTLATAGLDVTVLEMAERVGGGVRSSELTIPGLLHDECSGFHPLAVESAFARANDLEGHGLRWRWPEVQYSSPLDGGDGAAAFRSVDRTADGLGDDARGWRQVFGPLDARFGDIAEDFLRPVLRVPNHPTSLARFGLRAALPVSVLARRFGTPAGRALFAGVAAHALRPFSAVLSSAIGVALGAAAHAHGWPVAQGGSQTIATAMMSILADRGVAVQTGIHVRSLNDVGRADIVMLDVSPSAAVGIVGEAMPGRVRQALRRYRYGPGVFKVDFAVEGGVPWSHGDSRRAGTVHVGGSFAEVATAELAVNRGAMPERPFVLVGQQYLADPQRSNGDVHPLYSYAHVPAGYGGDATDAIEAQIERFAPGFRDRIAGRHVRTTTEIAVHNPNYVGGDVVAGANTARQLLFRPRASTNPYSLGAPGLYLCSAATPPGAGAHGMCGYNAATRALTDLGRRRTAE